MLIVSLSFIKHCAYSVRGLHMCRCAVVAPAFMQQTAKVTHGLARRILLTWHSGFQHSIYAKAVLCRRVTASFDARTMCDSRVYEYTFPEWVFDPDTFPAAPAWRPQGHPQNAAVVNADDKDSSSAAQVVSGFADGSQLLLRSGYSMTQPPGNSTFRFCEQCRARLNGILQGFVGTHNFHNFSPGVTPEQMSAQRCAQRFLHCVCRAVLNMQLVKCLSLEGRERVSTLGTQI